MKNKDQSTEKKLIFKKEEILKFDIPNKKDIEQRTVYEARIPITFSYKVMEKSKPSSVQICGSFDKWQVRHPLTYDALQNKWSVTLKIRKGTHYYKYIVDGEWSISDLEKLHTDENGFTNNTISI